MDTLETYQWRISLEKGALQRRWAKGGGGAGGEWWRWSRRGVAAAWDYFGPNLGPVGHGCCMREDCSVASWGYLRWLLYRCEGGEDGLSGR
jgi:hypothetical protein